MTDLSQSCSVAAKTPFGRKLIQLNLGMTLLGASFGLALPFAGDLIAWGPGSHTLSMLVILCALPFTATGVALIECSGFLKVGLNARPS